jgi:hypothetical protein
MAKGKETHKVDISELRYRGRLRGESLPHVLKVVIDITSTVRYPRP